MNKIVETIKGVFPNSEILLLYYSGSTAYGVQDNDSDIDVTVVLDNFKGYMHMHLGFFDAFIFSREDFEKRQKFDPSINLYYLASTDDVLNIKENTILLNESYKQELESLTIIDKKYIYNHLSAVVEYYKYRLDMSPIFKSNYHLLRIRGMLDNYDITGNYELAISESWRIKILDFKANWNNDIGKGYESVLREQLQYIDEYRNRMMIGGLE